MLPDDSQSDEKPDDLRRRKSEKTAQLGYRVRPEVKRINKQFTLYINDGVFQGRAGNLIAGAIREQIANYFWRNPDELTRFAQSEHTEITEDDIETIREWMMEVREKTLESARGIQSEMRSAGSGMELFSHGYEAIHSDNIEREMKKAAAAAQGIEKELDQELEKEITQDKIEEAVKEVNKEMIEAAIEEKVEEEVEKKLSGQ
jgi:ATP-dependent Lon protease